MLSNNPTAPCYMVAYCPHIAMLGWCMLLHLGVCIGPDNVGHGENADETLSFSTGDDRQQTDFMSTHLLHHPIECVIRMHGNQMPGGGNAIILPLPRVIASNFTTIVKSIGCYI